MSSFEEFLTAKAIQTTCKLCKFYLSTPDARDEINTAIEKRGISVRGGQGRPVIGPAKTTVRPVQIMQYLKQKYGADLTQNCVYEHFYSDHEARF